MDVTILGDGPAACATAIALRQAGVDRVLLVGGRHHEPPRIGESAPPELRRLLDQLDLDGAFLRQEHGPCQGSASSWGQPGLAWQDWVTPPWGYGWILDRQRFDDWLVEEAVSRGARWLPETRVEQVVRTDDGFEVPGLAEPTRLLVDATGSSSHLTRLLGVRRRVEDQLTFLYGVFERAPPPAHGSFTLLEGCRTGWWYAAKQLDGRLILAFATDVDTARQEALHEPMAWSIRLGETRHVSKLTAGGTSPDRVVVRHMSSSRLQRAGGDGWLAVGDAAACWDPLVGQGVCRALQDGLLAAETLCATLAGDERAISRYAEAQATSFDSYRRSRASLYAAEKRWFHEPFWRSRRDRSLDPPLVTSGEWPIPTPA